MMNNENIGDWAYVYATTLTVKILLTQKKTLWSVCIGFVKPVYCFSKGDCNYNHHDCTMWLCNQGNHGIFCSDMCTL